MPTLIDTLAQQGKPTDYGSRKSMYESLGLNNTYGNYVGSANQNINFMNVLQKQPNPAQLQPSTQAPVNQPQGVNQTVQANKQAFQPIKGFSTLQNQYAEQMYNVPDYASLYGQYSEQTGLKGVKDLILNIDNSVADIEDKIAKIEPNINKEVGNYLINETQRAKMVNAGELPLRTQYADILRSRSRLSAEATSKAELVNSLMGFAKESYAGRTDYLKTLMDIEKSNKSGNGIGNIEDYLKEGGGVGVDEPMPTETPQQMADRIFGTDVKISNESAKLKTDIKPKASTKYRGLISQPKGSNIG